MSTRILPSFALILPATLEDALKLAHKYRAKAKIIAGGTDVLVLMKNGSLAPEILIKLGSVKELQFARCSIKNGLSLGPLTTIREIEKSTAIGRMFPLMIEAARSFGNIQIENMATVGGNICNASPAGDMIPPLLAMNAYVDLMAASGKKTVKLADFFTGPGKSVMQPGEILVGIKAPPLSKRYGSCFFKISRTAEDLSKISVATVLSVQNGNFNDVRIALGAVASTPVRAVEAEYFLEGRKPSDATIAEAASIVCTAIAPISDERSTAAYRKDIACVTIKRALKKALERRTTR